ncbi:MAG: NEW3 domain-containing protein, partial [Candidatus Limnocylindrales bacterium]
NQSAEDLTFAVNAQGPDGWTVTATLTGQSQAASAVVKAGATSGITVTAQSPAATAAGSYPIQVVATAGSRQIPGTLQVVVTGSYSLSMSTPDQRLNTSGTAGQSTDFTLTLTNGGTAAVTNVKLGSTPPSGWTVTFEPATVASVDAGVTQNVVAHIVPSGDAVAGDYVVTMTANGDQSTSATEDIRFTVETSLVWAIVGIALIVAVFLGVWLVFRRYGRR